MLSPVDCSLVYLVSSAFFFYCSLAVIIFTRANPIPVAQLPFNGEPTHEHLEGLNKEVGA